LLFDLLNPKLPIFFADFLPQFMAITFVVFAPCGVFAAAIRDCVLSSPSVLAWLQRSFAAPFGLTAARLALTER
jgi:threonine/homoserine/homoserine lactone efflux protein